MSLIGAINAQNPLETKQLLLRGASLDEKDEEGRSAFILAIKNHMDMEIIDLFVQKGIDPLSVNEEGVGAIDIAIESKRLDVVKYLHEKGLDLNSSKRTSGMTPLMIAACYNSVEIAKYLILEDVDPECTDNYGMRAVDYATKLGQTSIKEFLQRV